MTQSDIMFMAVKSAKSFADFSYLRLPGKRIIGG